MSRRAVITGIGALSPVGSTVQQIAEAVRVGRSGIGPIDAFDTTAFRTSYGGEIRDFMPHEHLNDAELQRFPDRHLQLAVVAARQALHAARLDWSRDRRPDARCGIVVGTCNGGLKTAEMQYRILGGLEEGCLSRDTVLLLRYHTLGKALAYTFGVSGPSWVVTTACSSSTAAMGVAYELIENNLVDRLLIGGVDALCMASMAGFDTLKATADGGRTAPFSTPAGLNLGEAAAFWVLETEELALARGVPIQGELRGYALTSDAYHPTAPDPRGDGAYRTIMGATARAGMTVDELGCVNAHGTGTEANDRAESKGIQKAAGTAPLPVYSFKSQVGHCMGAAGIIEGTAGLIAMQRGFVPATVNFSEPRPGCGLDCVPNQPRESNYDAFVSCNYAFGGNNAGAVIGLHDARRQSSATTPRRRTVLTGSGTVTSLGLNNGRLLAGLLEGRRGFVPAGERVRGATRSQLGGYIQPFEARDVDRRVDFKSMNLLSRYATAAARFALADAGVRLSPKEGLQTGVVTGVYVGPSEEAHMELVTSTGGAGGDINGFAHIVANATGGWVSNALHLKGYSCTVAEGADSGLYSLLLAHLAIRSGASPRILAGASDELYSRYFHNYDDFEMLFEPEEEQNYRLRLDVEFRRMLAEGAAYVVAEERDQAVARGAEILAEVAGVGMSTDIDEFYQPGQDSAGLERAVAEALGAAGLSPQDVGLILWSPQGNRTDQRTLRALQNVLGHEQLPLITSVFHTGLSEATSGSMTLAAVLTAWREGQPLWRQITGYGPIDECELPSGPVPTLVVATSELGFNLCLALLPAEGDSGEREASV